jgi:hypothetical protein
MATQQQQTEPTPKDRPVGITAIAAGNLYGANKPALYALTNLGDIWATTDCKEWTLVWQAQ